MESLVEAPVDAASADVIELARATVDCEIAGLVALRDNFDESLNDAVRSILACEGRLVIIGVGKSGHVGRKMAATFASTGTPSFFVHATEAAHGDLGMLHKTDIALAISNSGESIELKPILQHCRRSGTTLLALTSNAESTLARFADIVLLMPPAKEACPLGLAPMTSTTMTLVAGDVLAAALIDARDFRRDDFAKFHPAGKLGAQLLRLHEYWEDNAENTRLPRVPHDASMIEVISAITSGERGVTGVEDENGDLIGLVTDGDLRRALQQKQSLDQKARDIMTSNLLSMPLDGLVIDAVRKCEEHRVGSLLIRDADGEIAGIIHLKDLLSTGVI